MAEAPPELGRGEQREEGRGEEGGAAQVARPGERAQSASSSTKAL
jgi:hypothetical protein